VSRDDALGVTLLVFVALWVITNGRIIWRVYSDRRAVATATGDDLDAIGDRWWFVRRTGESDASFRRRIEPAITR
jgi:hypothetical protein